MGPWPPNILRICVAGCLYFYGGCREHEAPIDHALVQKTEDKKNHEKSGLFFLSSVCILTSTSFLGSALFLDFDG